MKYDKFFAAVVLFSSLSSFCHADDMKGLNKRLLEPSTHVGVPVASSKQLPSEESSTVKNILYFAAGNLTGGAIIKACDSLSDDDWKIQMSDLKCKLNSMESDLVAEKNSNDCLEKKIKNLSKKIEMLENENKNLKHKDHCIKLDKKQVETLQKIINQLSLRVAKMHIFGEDCIGLARFLKEKNIDMTPWTRDESGDLERLAWKVHATGSGCASTLNIIEDWLQGDKSFSDVEESWDGHLKNLKDYGNDLS